VDLGIIDKIIIFCKFNDEIDKSLVSNNLETGYESTSLEKLMNVIALYLETLL